MTPMLIQRQAPIIGESGEWMQRIDQLAPILMLCPLP